MFSHYEIVNGQKKMVLKSFTAATKAEAEMKASQFSMDKKRFKSCDFTVGEAVDRYIESKEAVLSPSTIRGYLAARKRLGELEVLRVDILSSDDLQRWVSSLSAKLSPKSVKNTYALVSSALGVYTDKSFKVTLPARQPLQYNVPTDDQVQSLIDNARDDIKLAIVLAAVGTLRRGEICGLKQKDVLRAQNAVYIHTDMVYTKDCEWVHKEIPKTSESVRVVTLPIWVIDMIPEGDPEDYLISATPAAVSDYFRRLTDRLGLKCRFHDLRHYAASILHAIGVPDQYIMERGGWSTDGTLKAVYRNTLTDKSKEYSDRANDYFTEKLNQRLNQEQ